MTPAPCLRTGFTLVELMVALAVLGIAVAMGLNGLRTGIANARVRSEAEAIQGGLQLARSEAIRRNRRVEFLLTTTPPVAANVGSAQAAANGTHWMVRINNAGGGYSERDFIAGRPGEASPCVVVAAGQASFVFTGAGTLAALPPATVNINVGCAAADRPLRVTVSRAGAPRLCDPALAIADSPLGC